MGIDQKTDTRRERSLKLQELVRSSSLTRQQIADRLGVPKRTLDAWMQPYESKEHRNPSEVVVRLATISLKHSGQQP
jgi:DNA-binding transcriptional regulator YiaG